MTPAATPPPSRRTGFAGAIFDVDGVLVAEFWDCLRLAPEPVKALSTHLENHRRSGGRSDLVVDLNGVEFAGSSALSGFLGVQRQSRQGGGRVVFCNVVPQVREVFRVSKLESLFAFAADVPAALTFLAPGPAAPRDGDASRALPPPPRPEPPRSAPPPLRGRRRSS